MVKEKEKSDKVDESQLKDVAKEHKQEVIGVIQACRKMNVRELGFEGMRVQLELLNRMSGFSRQATIDLCVVLAKVQAAESSAGQPREAMQRAFVRMGGLRTIVNVLMLHLSSASVVAACVKVVALAVQGSCLAAEAMLTSGETSSVTLLLRTVERHIEDPDVALQGCTLISHMCASLPMATGDPRLARARAYRDCQVLISQSGAMELMLDALGVGAKEVKRAVSQVEDLVAREHANRPVDTGDKAKAPKAPPSAASKEITEAWAKVSRREARAAPIYENALQAILLLTAGNRENVRLLSGTLWARESAKIARHSSKEKDRSSPPVSAGPRGRKAKAEPEKKLVTTLGPGNGGLGTYEAFARSCAPWAEVLRSHVAKDRPSIAAKACRLILLLCDNQMALIEEIDAKARARAMVTKIFCGEGEGAPVTQPFAPVAPLVQSICHALRLHREDIPLMSVAVECLARIREISLRSMPVGAAGGEKEAVAEWRKVLHNCEKNSEFQRAALALEDALRDTDVALQRISACGANSKDLAGDGSFLTPRMRESARSAVKHALMLASDTLSVPWSKGEPGKAEEIEKAREALPPPVESDKEEEADDKEDESNESETSSSSGKKGNGKGKGKGKGKGEKGKGKGKKGKGKDIDSDEEEIEQEERVDWNAYPDFMKTNDWVRPLGYDEHDQADFDRVWKAPLEDVMARSFFDTRLSPSASAPTLGQHGTATHASTHPAGFASGAGAPLEQPDRIEMTLMESAPAKIRVRCVVPSANKVSMKVSDLRLQQLLTNEGSSKRITQEMTKMLRTQGYLMPRYGIELSVRKIKEAQLSEVPMLGQKKEEEEAEKEKEQEQEKEKEKEGKGGKGGKGKGRDHDSAAPVKLPPLRGRKSIK
eukprot:TRINITY_DN1083_c0_g1_i1.p1 TRINITY_DN1083_c0_g1~~TRINITY_DN1083_c0_g1_i1.p1  ORF type:complete len:884 (-),score=217.35 TRINITY_DN1083_c0_g1_i1:3-2654(-)